jgi:uncharacterized membrane protein YoaK (UPF0700 family)
MRVHWPSGARTLCALALLLAVATGSLDALAYLALGNVFVSVLTGNLVLLGVGLATSAHTAVVHVLIAIGSYGLGVAIAATIAGEPRDRQPLWPRRVSLALLVELAGLAAFTAGWEASDAHPMASLELGLLALAAAAMGIQSAAVNRLRLPGFSTTYLTSTFIRAVTELVTGQRGYVLVKAAALGAAVLGAAGGALLLSIAPRLVPVIALAALSGVLAAATLLSRLDRPLASRHDEESGW